MPHRKFAILLLTVAALALSACGMKSDINGFAAYPGFDAYFAAHPRTDQLPTEAEQALLERYRPILFLPPGHAGPIDFYRDYLTNTRMIDLADGKVLALSPKRDDLLAHNNHYTATVELILDPESTRPTVYGRVSRESVLFPTAEDDPTGIKKALTFLTYSIPFAHSGLPKKLGRGQELIIRLAEAILGWDRDDWHQLDVYVAYTLVLDDRNTPIAVLLAQHNHHRSYLIGKDLEWPEDDRLRLDVAASSNEIYLSSDDNGPVTHRVIPHPGYLDYLLSGEHPPLAHGWDVTHGPNAGGRAVDYALTFLPPSDPFYTFKGRLGAYRPFMGRYVGRSGSPGADYYTMPPLLPLGTTLKFAYLQDGDPDDIAMVRTYIDDDFSRNIDPVVHYGGRTFYADWMALGGGCNC